MKILIKLILGIYVLCTADYCCDNDATGLYAASVMILLVIAGYILVDIYEYLSLDIYDTYDQYGNKTNKTWNDVWNYDENDYKPKKYDRRYSSMTDLTAKEIDKNYKPNHNKIEIIEDGDSN